MFNTLLIYFHLLLEGESFFLLFYMHKSMMQNMNYTVILLNLYC